MKKILKGIALSLLLFISTTAWAQNKTVKGRVLGEDGVAISGASITVKNSSVGTISNESGEFSISVQPSAKILVIKSLGYEPQEVAVGGGVIQVSLSKTVTKLDEVVVVAYSSVKKSTFTGAATTIKNALIENRSNSSFQESLQGNIAGVQSSNGSGNPGALPFIRVRGIGSINASSMPLYVVDGVPVVTSDVANSGQSNPLAGINANDILNLTVLKDASATSLYGSRAANGVILITTKRGNSGKAKISFSMQQGINTPTIRDYQKPLTTAEYIQYFKEGWINAGGKENNYDSLLLSKGVDKNINTDWFGLTFRVGRYSQYNLNVSGGNEKTTYFISANIFNSQGPIKTEDYKKASYRINVNSQVTNRWTIKGGVSANYQNSSDFSENTTGANPVRNAYRVAPWISPYLADGVTWNLNFNGSYNPVAILETIRKKNKLYNFSANGFSEFKIFNGLTFENTFGIDFNHAFRTVSHDSRIGSVYIARGGQIEDFSNDVSNVIATNIIRYKKTFNEKHNVEIFLGYEAQAINERNLSVAVNNIAPGIYTPAGGSVVRAGTGSGNANAVTGKFANASYSFDDRYFLTGSIRQDASSKFALNYQSANFWSVGGGWNIHKEKFLLPNWINELKIRGSFGYTGNNNGFGNFESQGLYSVFNDYNAYSGFALSQLANNNLTWEKNNPFDIGMDFALLKSRLSGSIDWYTRTTSNLILDQPIPSLNGVTSITVNGGAMKNTGIELALSAVVIAPKRNDGFKWIVDMNYTSNKNKITEIDSNFTNNVDYYRRVGYDYYTMYQISYAGVNPQNGEALWHAKNSKDSTTNAYSPSLPRFTHGSATPKFYGSITNAFSYKNFGMRFQLYVFWGNVIYDELGPLYQSDANTGFIDISNGISKGDYSRRWTTPGQITDVPKPVYLGNQSGGSAFKSTRFLYDGSYIRLRDVSLSYTLKPESFSKSKININSARFYITGQNLFTYTKDKRLYTDPEVGIDGKLTGRPPVFNTLTFGLDINF